MNTCELFDKASATVPVGTDRREPVPACAVEVSPPDGEPFHREIEPLEARRVTHLGHQLYTPSTDPRSP